MNNIYKIPPQAIEIEESILVACILYKESLTEAAEGLRPEYFYKSAHQKIFTAMIELYNKKEPVELPILVNTLKKKGWLEEIGGATYLVNLIDNVPLATNILSSINIIREKAALRQTIEKCNNIVMECFEDSNEAIKIIDNAQKEILSVEIEDPNGKTYSTMPEIIEEGIDLLEERSDSKGKITGVSTGFDRLDYLIWGLQPSDLTLIAARPSAGKTAFALNIARNAVFENIPVAIFSLEMSKQQLLFRLFSDQAKINSQKFKSGMFTHDEWANLTDAAGVINDLPMFIDDSAGLHIQQIQRRARKMYKKHKIGLIVVDYIQLVIGEGKNRDREISSISMGLKNLAKELNIPVIALSQLSRKLEERNNKRPRLSDLRDSGTLEQDADIVMFIYRDEMYNDNENNPYRGKAEIIVAKQRNGPVGKIELAFVDKYTSFYPLAHEDY